MDKLISSALLLLALSTVTWGAEIVLTDIPAMTIAIAHPTPTPISFAALQDDDGADCTQVLVEIDGETYPHEICNE